MSTSRQNESTAYPRKVIYTKEHIPKFTGRISRSAEAGEECFLGIFKYALELNCTSRQELERAEEFISKSFKTPEISDITSDPIMFFKLQGRNNYLVLCFKTKKPSQTQIIEVFDRLVELSRLEELLYNLTRRETNKIQDSAASDESG